MTNRKSIISTIASIFITIALCIAPISAAHSNGKVGPSLKYFGLSTFYILTDEHTVIVNPEFSGSPDHTTLENFAKNYSHAKYRLTLGGNAPGWLANGVLIGGAVLATPVTGGMSLVALAIVGPVLGDHFQQSARNKVDNITQGILIEKKAELEEIIGTNFENRYQFSPDELRNEIDEKLQMGEYLIELTGGDKNIAELVDKILYENIVDGIVLNTENIIDVQNEVNALKNDFRKFEVDVVKVLNQFGEQQDLHRKLLIEQSKAISSLEDRYNVIGADVNNIKKYLFNGSSIDTRIDMLNNNFLSNAQICSTSTGACPDDVIQSIKSKLRADLLLQKNLQKSQKELYSRSKAAAKFNQWVGALSNAITTFSDDAEINQTVNQLATVAMTAANFYGGNYPGAIVSFVSLFASAEESEFVALYEYLDKQFSEVNLKLDSVIENQQIIHQTMIDLSKQLQAINEDLGNSLDSIEFNTLLIADGVRDLIWNKWLPCASVHTYVVENSSDLSYSSNYGFQSIANTDQLFTDRSQDVRDCVNQAQSFSASILLNDFVLPTDARYILNFDDEILRNRGLLVDRENKKNIIKDYIESVVDISYRELINYSAVNSMPALRIGTSILNPNSRFQDNVLLTHNPIEYDICNPERFSPARFRLLCSPATDSSKIVDKLLKTPVSASATLDLAKWLLIAARVADIQYFRDLGIETIDDLDFDNNEYSTPPGHQIYVDLLLLLDSSIAHTTALNGQLLSQAILETLKAHKYRDSLKEDSRIKKTKDSLNLLSINPHLAINISNLVIQSQPEYSEFINNEEFMEAYKAAQLIEFNSDKKNNILNSLNKSLDSRIAFVFDDQSDELMIDISSLINLSKSHNIDLPVTISTPSILELATRKINYPASLHQVISLREHIVEQIIGYELFLEYDETEVEKLANIIALGRSSLQ